MRHGRLIGVLSKPDASGQTLRPWSEGRGTFDSFSRGAPVKKKTNTLTSREAEVLQLIAEGYANKQIAAELSISIKTVEKHRQQVMNKLNIHDVAGLTRHAISKGIIETNAPVNSL